MNDLLLLVMQRLPTSVPCREPSARVFFVKVSLASCHSRPPFSPLAVETSYSKLLHALVALFALAVDLGACRHSGVVGCLSPQGRAASAVVRHYTARPSRRSLPKDTQSNPPSISVTVQYAHCRLRGTCSSARGSFFVNVMLPARRSLPALRKIDADALLSVAVARFGH